MPSSPRRQTLRSDNTPKLGIENVFDFPISYLLLKGILKNIHSTADFSFSVHCTLSFVIYSREIRVKIINFREKFQVKRFPSRNETRIIYLNCPTFANANRNLFHKSSPKRTNFSSSQFLLAGNFEDWNIERLRGASGVRHRLLSSRGNRYPASRLRRIRSPRGSSRGLIRSLCLGASRVDKIADGKSAPRFVT